MKKKWIIQRHTSDMHLLVSVLRLILDKGISPSEQESLLGELEKKNLYNRRFGAIKIATLSNKINQLCFYMFGYKKNNKFLISPLGREFIKNYRNKDKRRKIFVSMLYGLQYPHPHSQTDKIFNLFPFRLIFKLLTDNRIDNKLYADEVAAIVMFEFRASEGDYESLIQKILNFRKLKKEEVFERFKEDELTLVNAIYEWDYFTTAILVKEGVLIHTCEYQIGTLQHGKDTHRKLNKAYVKLSPDIFEFVIEMEKQFSFLEKPRGLEDQLTEDWTTEIYNFFPIKLIEELNIKDPTQIFGIKMLALPSNINQYANNNLKDKNSANKFEGVLNEALNLFSDVDSSLISGPGNTDIECIYLPKKEKFLVEAKSTRNKLTSLNPGRLKQHLEKHKGKYTLVITPRYVPAVLGDIRNTQIVIIKSASFSEYIYNHLVAGDRDIRYSKIRDLLLTRMGTDISEHISKITLDKYSLE